MQTGSRKVGGRLRRGRENGILRASSRSKISVTPVSWDGTLSKSEKVEEFSVNVCRCTRLNKQPLRHFDGKEKENIGSRGMVVETWGAHPKEASFEINLAMLISLRTSTEYGLQISSTNQLF